jgi:outer membrane protein assembly factor BamB
MKNALAITALTVVFLSGPAAADPNWPQFRGPGGRGVVEDGAPPSTWSTTENVLWKVEIPGRGWSSPIVWGNRVFLTTASSAGEVEDAKKGLYYGGNRDKASPHAHRWRVFALDAGTGKVLWDREAAAGKPETPLHIKNSYASETPVTDGERVYAYFGNRGLFVYDLDGKLVWSKTLGIVKTRYDWGTAASPVLHGERLYIVNDNEEKSFLAAFDRKTGDEVLRIERDEKSNWATPFIWQAGGRTEIITSGSGKVRAYDLEGKALWELQGMSSITIPTPFAAHGLLYVASGFVMDKLRPVYAVRPGAAGDISLKEDETANASIVWCDREAAPYNPSTLVYGDHFYTLFDRGLLGCFDARTGKPAYRRQRISPEAAAFTASPWAAGDKVFCLSEDGDTFVIRAGPSFELLGINRLEEMCMATPAIAGGRLFIRTLTKLYAIGKKDAAKE